MSDRFEKFELFRLSLIPRPQRDLIEGKDPTREEYLRNIFTKGFVFNHRGNGFHYVPSESQSSGKILLGRIGRNIETEENLSPEEGLAEYTRSGWKACVIVIDPAHHEDGQKVALEVDKAVGSPISLISSLAQHINESNPHSAYNVEISPIFDAISFWHFADKNKGQVTSLNFEFIAPNMFGGSDSITEELRNFRNIEKAQKVSIGISSNDGIDTTTEKVKESVDYAQRGGGKITARAKKNKRYNSTKKAKHVTIKSDSSDKEPLLIRAARRIHEVLGHE